MSDYFINSIPTVQERKANYRGNISSKDLNEGQSELLHDILDLFNKSNKLEKDIEEFTMLSTMLFSIMQLQAMTKASVNLLLEEIEQTSNDPDSMKRKSCYAAKADIENTKYDAIINKVTEDITANTISSISKIRVFSEAYNEAFVPQSVKVFVGPDSFKNNEHVLSIEDNDIKKAFDGDSRTSWFRRIITDETMTEVENEVVVGLPEDIITTRMINQIVLQPFPYCDIVDVQTKVNGAWTTVPGFLNHNEIREVKRVDSFGNITYQKVIENTNGIKLNFPDIYTNQVKVKLRKKDYEEDKENNRRIWYLGLNRFDINYNRYTKNQSIFSMVYDFTNEDPNKEIRIYDSKVYLNNEKFDEKVGSNFNISKEYYYFDEYDNTHKIASTAPFVLEGRKLMIRYIMEANKETPNVYKCEVNYKIS